MEKCNYHPQPKGILLVSKYLIRKYGTEEAVRRSIQRVIKGKGPGKAAYYVLQPNQY